MRALGALVLLQLLACEVQSEAPPRTDLKDFATHYAAAWSSQSPDRLASFYADSGKLIVNGAPSVGRAAIRATAEGFMAAFPDMLVRMDSVIDRGDQAVFHWTWTGTNTGPDGTGRAVRISGYEEWTMADGLILESNGHYDDADYQRQVNAVATIATKPASPDAIAAPVESASVIVAADTSSFMTPLELANLGATLVIPVPGITRAQLRDTYAEPRGGRVHEALDILAARGTPVLSATDGRLLKLFNSKAGGLMVYATDKSERFILLYGHLDSYAPGLGDGMRLKRGQLIGYVGTTGNAPPGTPHLHFGILRGNPKKSWSKGTPVNPYPLLVKN
jgi:murein DD-endopeptidase MepM/ murein hydrolase activator NlpD